MCKNAAEEGQNCYLFFYNEKYLMANDRCCIFIANICFVSNYRVSDMSGLLVAVVPLGQPDDTMIGQSALLSMPLP
jgi:hypothetical protein